MGYSVVIVRTRKLKGRKSMLDLVAFKNFLATRPLFSFFPFSTTIGAAIVALFLALGPGCGNGLGGYLTGWYLA
jgi:hypothetical protein